MLANTNVPSTANPPRMSENGLAPSASTLQAPPADVNQNKLPSSQMNHQGGIAQAVEQRSLHPNFLANRPDLTLQMQKLLEQ